jgi:hypothetical protein
MAINLKAYKHITDDIKVGETVRINHDDCSAGTDTRRRLYITRPQSNPDAVVAYCHNCQQGGYIKTGTHEVYRATRHLNPTVSPPQEVVDKLLIPQGMISDLSDWPVDGIAWAFKNKLNQALITKYDIQYDVNTNRVYLPRYRGVFGDSCQNLMGYQLRNVDPCLKAPKYLTVVDSTDRGFTCIRENGCMVPMGTVAIIVEDLISGIHVVQACLTLSEYNVVVYVNYGTKVQLDLLASASKMGNVLIWLDNDSSHVLVQGRTMSRTTKLIDGDCWVYMEGIKCDPKNVTYDRIRQRISDYGWAKNGHRSGVSN